MIQRSNPTMISTRTRSHKQRKATTAAVAIGRNEGDRLQRCLASLMQHVGHVVYVDSGSRDGSVAVARAMGAEVVELDPARPFTAARARNAGIRRLLELDAGLAYVQVVDGDCNLVPGWLDAAKRRLDADPTLAVVCGRRRERYPDATRYNRLMDMEWNTPTGDAMSCGGDAMVRVAAIDDVAGYDESLICGEEPELCSRLRQRGWRIERIDHDMTVHDADMTHWRQWWRRSERGGWAIAQATATHESDSRRQYASRSRSVWFWGLLLPLAVIGLAWPTRGRSAFALLLYLGLGWRVYQHRRERGDEPPDARMYAAFCALGKFPEAAGQVRYWWRRVRGRPARLIEYKRAGDVSTSARPHQQQGGRR